MLTEVVEEELGVAAAVMAAGIEAKEEGKEKVVVAEKAEEAEEAEEVTIAAVETSTAAQKATAKLKTPSPLHGLLPLPFPPLINP
mmetsp:Transcript_90359/g.132206  ORF Transcript_90359/g.132206 Transcript_90359/m.132206 type:complete len:85 (+) Transcript_90359:359-613(+)